MDTTGCFEVHAKFAQSCPILCDPMDDSPPGYSVHAGSPGKNTGVGCHALLQGAFPIQGSNPVFHIAGGFFTTWSTREAKITILMGCKVMLCTLCSFAKSVYALKWHHRVLLPWSKRHFELSNQLVINFALGICTFVLYIYVPISAWTNPKIQV